MTPANPSSISSAFQVIKDRSFSNWQVTPDSDCPVITIGTATCGRAAGALEVKEAIINELQKRNLTCQVIEVGCIGHCYAEPLVTVKKPGSAAVCYGNVNPFIAERLVKDCLLGDEPCLEFVLAAVEPHEMIPSFDDFPRAAYEKKIILENCGFVDPEEIDSYITSGGYSALEKVLQVSPDEIISRIKESGLRGRGGAGFTTGQKWDICRNAAGKPKYVICNADEGDPGAFMDRNILESDPHSVLEGMLIAGYAIGARYGYIYIRSEYPLAVKRVRTAVRQARKTGLLGKNILNSDYSFDIRIFQGSGAFVCGEETALITSMAGNAGIPYHRPPYPANEGLYGKPTIINNVKTLAFIRHIIEKGVDWFKAIGTEDNTGTAVFALAGKVVSTGLVEVPMGSTLRNIIFDVASGVPDGRHFKAVQIGGPSGGCIPESELDTPVDFDSLKKVGAMMGSGGMIVLNEDDCMVEMARYLMEFACRESCGKCTFCRLGTRQMLEILERITRGLGEPEDIDRLQSLAEALQEGSHCNLGKTAANPVLTTIRYFLDEYKAHIYEKRCPALMCPELISFYIQRDKCERSCDACIGTCTVEAISPDKYRIKVIDQDKCVKCGTCIPSCPPQYNAIIKVSPPDAIPVAGTSK